LSLAQGVAFSPFSAQSDNVYRLGSHKDVAMGRGNLAKMGENVTIIDSDLTGK
jgi:hypothetical protein